VRTARFYASSARRRDANRSARGALVLQYELTRVEGRSTRRVFAQRVALSGPTAPRAVTMSRVSRFSLRLFLVSLLLVACSAFFGGGKKEAAVKTGGAKTVDELQIGIKKRPEKCEQLATDGDHVWVHYRGTLLDGGEQFDASCTYRWHE
jgi:hypothetical protein